MSNLQERSYTGILDKPLNDNLHEAFVEFLRLHLSKEAKLKLNEYTQINGVDEWDALMDIPVDRGFDYAGTTEQILVTRYQLYKSLLEGWGDLNHQALEARNKVAIKEGKQLFQHMVNICGEWQKEESKFYKKCSRIEGVFEKIFAY